MITSKSTIRVRYDEVDQMGYVYHGNYAKYYHVARTDLLHKLGVSDKELENEGLILPVIEMKSRFIKPIFYDDTIIILASLIEKPRSRMKFSYKIFNKENEIVNEASTTLVFMEEKNRRLIRIPDTISKKYDLFTQLIKQ